MNDNVPAPWFVYERTAGRITARPVHLAGWLVLSLAVLVPMSVGLLAGPRLMAIHPLLFVAVLVGAMLVSLGGLFALVLRRGRPAGGA